MNWSHHLLLIPVLLPLLCGALLIPVSETRHQLKFLVNLGGVLSLLGVAITLLTLLYRGHWDDDIGVYLAGNWAAPFGITLVVDRLAALLLLLNAVLATAALCYAMQRWARIGVHFHSLFQFLLMGINGAFLTHDLFNLFVFFEVMLAASYGLLLHGYNPTRLRASMQFVVVNLLASFVLLIGIALIYAASGTLNMADLAGRVAGLDTDSLALLQLGMAVMAIAFLIKSAMWPLGFWLPTTYAAASPPVAAMLVLMTKVGVYALLRLWLLVFGGDHQAAGFGFTTLLWGGVATLVFGAVGMLATDHFGRLAGYAAIASSGTLLALIGLNQGALLGAVLYYLVSSTLGIGAYVLLIELVERTRNPLEAILAVDMEAYAFEEAPDQPVGVGIPAALAFLGLAFAACALVIIGLPPLSGFVAKFGLLHGLLAGVDGSNGGVNVLLMVLLLLSGLAALIALLRTGVRTFWASGAVPARLRRSEAAPVTALLLLCVWLSVQAGPVAAYLERTSTDLQQPSRYVQRVLEEAAVPGVTEAVPPVPALEVGS